MAEKIIGLVPGATDLPQYNRHDVSVISKPQCPGKEDYTYGDDNNPEFDEDEYNDAMDSYHRELEIYNLHVESGHYHTALLLDNTCFQPVSFSLEKPKQYSIEGNIITAKEVQAAIKSGAATPELLEAEIGRIRQREKRAQEMDGEKIHLTVHKQLSAFVN